jgi:NAD(P)H-hydrate epimerase
MKSMIFETENGIPVPAVTEDQMRQVDQIAVEEFNLSILQMMENAGRALAENAFAILGSRPRNVTVLAGPGGNGGGGICAARHMHNRGLDVSLVLATSKTKIHDAAAAQLEILQSTQVSLIPQADAKKTIRSAALVVDALLGYSLRGAPKGRVKELIELCNREAARVLSLDIPSGMNATTGDEPGVSITGAERTLTLALPKTGLQKYPGELYLADIGIPPEVYRKLDLNGEPFFGSNSWVKMKLIQPAE